MKIAPGDLPTRIILSRKGCDADWGGASSLICDDELISLPIPEHSRKERKSKLPCEQDHLRYRDLPPHKRIGNFHSYLPALKENDCVHLDPDIRPSLRKPAHRDKPFLFGQNAVSETHLRNQKIDRGDLFLFFGWFRAATCDGRKWHRVGPDMHVIWGWLQVAQRHPVESDVDRRKLDWADHHPHVSHWRPQSRGATNAIYESTKALSFSVEHPGAGVFKYSTSLILSRTCAPASRRHWCVPRFFRETGMTYHTLATSEPCQGIKDNVHFASADRGQEFVVPGESKSLQDYSPSTQTQICRWLEELYSGEGCDSGNLGDNYEA